MDDSIHDVSQLEDVLSRPTEQVVRSMSQLEGDLVFLGVGGKMGPTMARMAKRGSDQAGVNRRVIGVSRFSDEAIRSKLENWGIETIACDLLNESEVDRLPEARNVISMSGMKFGTGKNAGLTWAMNCYLPPLICRKYRSSRIAAFSTGNVYGMVDASTGGSNVTDEPDPHGEYSMSALGRERMYQYCSDQWQIPMVLLRLNYATELRYGVLVDLAQQIHARKPVDVSMGYVNVIWLADANAMTLNSLGHVSSPVRTLNVAGTDIVGLRDLSARLARHMELPVEFVGQEQHKAYLNNGADAHDVLGRPSVSLDEMVQWTADWVQNGRPSLGKPTHFQVRNGKF